MLINFLDSSLHIIFRIASSFLILYLS